MCLPTSGASQPEEDAPLAARGIIRPQGAYP